MKKPLLIGLIALAGIGGYFGYKAVFGCGPDCCQQTASSDVAKASLVNGEEVESYTVGSTAANFSLKNIQNDQLQSLNDLKGANGTSCGVAPCHMLIVPPRFNEATEL